MSKSRWLLGLLAAAALWACAGEPALPEEGVGPLDVELSSLAFGEGASIPARFTCEGEDLSPPLAWSGVPEETRSLVLIVDDPDAPRGTWVHWVIYDMASTLTGLDEGIPTDSQVEGVGLQGVNDFRNTGYGGPCPPSGSDHRYIFKLYALDAALGLPPGATKGDVEAAMNGHILAQGQLMGRFAR